MKTTSIFVWLVAIVGLAGCINPAPKGDHQKQPIVTHVFFKAHNIHVWSYLPIADSVGVETSERGAFSVGGDGWVKYVDGPRVEVAGTKFLFNQETVPVTALNMVVDRTNFMTGSFIRTFE